MLDDAVLAATLELLGERGYQALRIADIAERAGTGLGAVYRRWPGKRDVVLAALERAVPDRDLPRTDDPAEDVLAGLRSIARATAGPEGRILSGLLPELAEDHELARLVADGLLGSIRRENRERARRLVGDVPDLDVRADLAPAYLLLHGLFLGRDVPEEELRHLLALTLRSDDRAPASRSPVRGLAPAVVTGRDGTVDEGTGASPRS